MSDVDELRKQVRLLQEGFARHRAVLETQDLFILQTLRLACRNSAVQDQYRRLLREMEAGLRRSETAAVGIPDELIQPAHEAALSHLAMYREAVELKE